MRTNAVLAFLIFAGILSASFDARAIIGGDLVRGKLRVHERAIVGLQMFNKRNGFIGNCSGVLIRADAVLTAAHCFDAKVAPDLAWTRVLRQTDINTFAEDSRSRRSKNVVPHPLYNSQAKIVEGRYFPTYDHDLAIVFLDAAMPASADAEPGAPIEVAHLADAATEITAGMQLTSYGFGRSKEVSFFALEDPNFMHLQTGVFVATGRRVYGSFTMKLSDVNLCTGDSGGPNFLLSNDEPVVMAVTSAAASGTTWYGRRKCRGEASLQPVSEEREWMDRTLLANP